MFGIEDYSTIVSLDNLSLLYLHMGAYAKAEPLLVLSVDTHEKLDGPESQPTAKALANLAVFYENTGQPTRARALYERALSITERANGTESAYVADELNHLAHLEVTQGNLAKAVALQERALAIHEKDPGPQSPDAAGDLAALGGIYLAEGDLKRARPYLEQALAIRERIFGSDSPTTIYSLSTWSNLLWQEGKIGDAIAAQARANEARERELVRNLTIGSEERKLSYLALTARELDRTISLHQRAAPRNATAAQAALTIILRRKGRALDAMTRQLEAVQQHSTPEDRMLLAELSIVRAEYARKTLANSAETKDSQYQAELLQLAQQIEDLESRVALRGAALRSSVLPVSLDAIRAAIPDGAALVEIASYEPFNSKTRRFEPRRYATYVCGASGAIRWADLGLAAEIDALVSRYRDRLRSSDDEPAAQRVARDVDERVMRPIRKLIGPAITRLLVAPDGALNLLPLAALVDERGKYLVERYDIVYLTSGRDLLRMGGSAPKPLGSVPEVVANPDFGATVQDGSIQFLPLPGTEAEAKAIAGLLPDATVIMGAQATESAIKQVRGPSILHIATHGFFLTDEARKGPEETARREWEATREIVQTTAPGSVLAEARDPLLRSGLGFAGANKPAAASKDDGLLTALEATGLDLWGTKLVVLSACDTGVGEVRTGNGVYGLRRALTLAGAESQLTSLWAVSDLVTKDLMVAYYRELLAGRGRSEALRRTQLAMIRDPQRRHPFYWAGFIPIGEWRPLVDATHQDPEAVP